MLYPRLASLGIVLLSTFLFLGFQFWPLPSTDSEVQLNVLKQAFVIGMVLSLFGVFAGIGGIIASFGIELERQGYFKTRNNHFGRLVAKTGANNFCQAGSLCGLVLLFGLLAVSITGFLAFLIIPNWQDFIAILPDIGLQMLKMFGVLLAIIGPYFIACIFAKRSPLSGLAVGILLYGALVGYFFYKNDLPPVSHTLEEFLAFVATLVAVGIFCGACYGLYRLLKKIPYYQDVCPVRAERA